MAGQPTFLEYLALFFQSVYSLFAIIMLYMVANFFKFKKCVLIYFYSYLHNRLIHLEGLGMESTSLRMQLIETSTCLIE